MLSVPTASPRLASPRLCGGIREVVTQRDSRTDTPRHLAGLMACLRNLLRGYRRLPTVTRLIAFLTCFPGGDDRRIAAVTTTTMKAMFSA
ncbi:hypothetical protein E2C01_046164 [Portunus trituberculatus]|uniref:Uncharacterized protein n=1 Tax=Portunus trituberculatus TaxID=210409 RepID=A0A5B7FX44_PORTR|nr:hypothetical protein [Portunus trituberculatus]